MLQEGDIIEIPLPNGKTALGWLLYTSSVFKNVVGLVIFGLVGESRRAAYEAAGALDVLGPLYTNSAALQPYGCRVVGHQAVTPDRKLLTKRLVGGGVYVGDDYIGSPKETGDPDLHEMKVMGMPVLLERIRQAFG